MTIASTLKQYLGENGIAYETIPHPYTDSATKTAQVAHVSGENIAKAVVLKESGNYLLAVLPAARHIRFADLGAWLGGKVELAKEEETESIFHDCDLGAIPPVGKAYGLDVVIDESLAGNGEIYFEGGDHSTLVKVSAEDFGRLTEGARRGQFSRHDA